VIDLTVTALAVLTCLALILRLPVRPILYGSVAAFLAVLFVVQLVLASRVPEFNFDFRIFYEVGRDVWAGRDPYAPDRFADHPFLNPPTALPLFALFAALPPDLSGAIWTVGNALACCALVVLARPALGEGGRDDPAGAGASCLAVLTATLATSDAALANFYTGQLGILTALALVLALRARSLGRPVRAGLWLAVAMVKPTTALPFLLLFCRRPDRRAWLALAGGVAGLCLLATPPWELPGRLASLAGHIAELSAPGAVNDYSFQGTQHLTLLSLDHALYCLGLRDRRLIQVGQLILLAALGAWVAFAILGRRRLPEAAATSLVALFSLVFLYHRLYDAVILVLPLTYCTGRARGTSGPARWLFVAAATGQLAVLFLRRDFLAAALEFSEGGGLVGRIVQAAVLPCATWAILLSMFCLVAAVRRVPPDGASEGAPCRV
jgi:hypothetical protein